MPFENYCIDDVALEHVLDPQVAPRVSVESFIDTIEYLIKSGQTIFAPSTILQIELAQGLTFDALLALDFSVIDSLDGIGRDLWGRLLQLRRRIVVIDIDDPPVHQLIDSQGSCIRHSVQSGCADLVHNFPYDLGTRTSTFILLGTGAKFPNTGPYELHVPEFQAKGIFALRDFSDRHIAIRWVLQEMDVTEAEFFEFWSIAFASSRRADDLTFRRFQGTFSKVKSETIRHLCFLNDHFLQLWQECGMDFATFKRKAKAGFGIDFSNESVKTRGSKHMKLREASFAGKIVICELHSKLTRQINRIHFHPPIDSVEKGKMLIGIFVDHLKT